MTLHLIPEPEENASELLRDLTAKLQMTPGLQHPVLDNHEGCVP